MKKLKFKKKHTNTVRYSVRRPAIAEQASDYVESFFMFQSDLSRLVDSINKVIHEFEELYDQAVNDKKSLSRKELVRETQFLMTDFNDAISGLRETSNMFLDLTGEIEDSFIADIERRSDVAQNEPR